MGIMEDSAQVNSNVDIPVANPSDDVIIVNNWGELKTYCEKTDKNYVLQLKENTNFIRAMELMNLIRLLFEIM